MDRARLCAEQVRPLRNRAAGLFGVGRVVETNGQKLRRTPHRRKQLHLAKRTDEAATLLCAREDAQPIGVTCEEIIDRGRQICIRAAHVEHRRIVEQDAGARAVFLSKAGDSHAGGIERLLPSRLASLAEAHERPLACAREHPGRSTHVIARVRAALLRAYRASERELPWRGQRDPYRVWVAEVLLQQTRADVVANRYPEFLAQFPCVEALAAAPVERVCEAWAGLGYYARARNLHAAAREIVGSWNGTWPTEYADWRRLPGVGDYTAGAVTSIAFARREPAVDTNCLRVLSRVFGLAEPSLAARRRRVRAIAAQLVACDEPGAVNQALMDIGSTVCRPRTPDCGNCGLRRLCTARGKGDVDAYLPPRTRTRRRVVAAAFAYVRDRRGVWLERRPLEGLWAGLWQPPAAFGTDARRQLSQRLGVDLVEMPIRVAHALSHRRIEARVFRCRTPAGWRVNARLRPFRKPEEAGLSALARKILGAIERLPPSERRLD